MSQKSNYALRLQSSLKTEAEKLAKEEGTTLNQFINVAVAEKLSALRTYTYFKNRAHRADITDVLDILERSGQPGHVQDGDELSVPRT
jgi:hypothetical protein